MVGDATTDIAHAHHQAMLSAQTRMLTTGTHYGGDILGFYHYWYRFHPQFWRRLGLGWNDAEKALERYGVIQEWTKEYESDARRGSGQTSVQVSTIPAPGLSAKLIPYLLEDLVYLTVLEVGAHMPPRIEIPEIVSMRDSEIEEQVRAVVEARQEAASRLADHAGSLGDSLGRHLLASTERLVWEHLYPLERRLISLVAQERSEGRRVMLYTEQNDLRSTARRLEWVLKEMHPWTLPNSVAAEDRQQAILRAVREGHTVVIVPYRRVNEGLNLQSGIDTVIWVEMALNLFMLDQASRPSPNST